MGESPGGFVERSKITRPDLSKNSLAASRLRVFPSRQSSEQRLIHVPDGERAWLRVKWIRENGRASAPADQRLKSSCAPARGPGSCARTPSRNRSEHTQERNAVTMNST